MFSLKLALTLASLAIIYKSAISTGDPTNLFSNLMVLYAMYSLSYIEQSKRLKKGFLLFTQTLVIIVGFICFTGWIDIITIIEVNDQFFIGFPDSMKLGNYAIINVHIFFLILALKLSFVSGLEWIMRIDDENLGENNNQIGKRKGA